MNMIYQDKLEPGNRQLEFIVKGKDEIKVLGDVKHHVKHHVKHQSGLEAYGIPKENQRTL